MLVADEGRVIRSGGLNEFFHRALHRAAGERRLRADDATLHYLALLLCQYARSERLFDYSDQRLQLRPLALLYGAALEARGTRERRLWLQRLGDLALFVGGLFAGRLSRHFQDLDYCVAIGGNAYGYLQQTATGPGQQAQASVFGELAGRFDRFVDLVATVTGAQGQAPWVEQSTGSPDNGLPVEAAPPLRTTRVQ